MRTQKNEGPAAPPGPRGPGLRRRMPKSATVVRICQGGRRGQEQLGEVAFTSLNIENRGPELCRDFDSYDMGENRIEPGQVWRADLGGHETRVFVVSPHSAVPEVWVCERLGTDQGLGKGMHVLVASNEFTKLERPVSEGAD